MILRIHIDIENQYPLSMIDNVIKKYLQIAIKKTNTGSMPAEMPNIETRYFKFSFIRMYSKVTQNKLKNSVLSSFSAQRFFINLLV